MLLKVTLLPGDLSVIARNWVERFVVLLDVIVTTLLRWAYPCVVNSKHFASDW